MKYAICTVPAAPVRKEPSHRTEMTNQLLFGETMHVLEQNDEWFKIRSTYDNYEGWLTYHLIEEVDESIATAPVRYVATSLINIITHTDQLINAPMGSVLAGYDEETRLLWNGLYKYHGTIQDVQKPSSPDLFDKTVHAWMNAPYLWGGKTLMGVDCSGFAQTVFKVMGITLHRDAYQQAEQGNPVDNLALAKKGDLAFFHNEAGRITHVGIVLSPNEIIHSSGNVRVDKLDAQGITNREKGIRTHQLHSIRRHL